MKKLLVLGLFPFIGFSQTDTVKLSSLPKNKQDNNRYYKSGKPFSGVGHTSGGNTYSYVEIENGIKHGKFVEYWSDTKEIRVRGTYDNGIQHGMWTYTYPNGDTMQHGAFYYGEQDGHWYSFYEGEGPNKAGIKSYRYFEKGIKEGRLFQIDLLGDTVKAGNYVNDFEVGHWRIYNYKTQELESKHFPSTKEKKKQLPKNVGKRDLINRNEVYYYENVPYTGMFLKKHPNGQISRKVVYKKGLIVSEEGYYENGKPYIETSYKKGLKNGLWKHYGVDGLLSTTIEYKKGEFHGEYSTYNEKGWKRTMTTYSNGLRNGVRKEWSDQFEGILKQEFNYRNDTLHGVSKRYSNEGNLVELRTYQMGKLSGPAKFYDEKGNLISEGKYKENYAKTNKTYYESGELKSELKQVKDHKQFYVEYYETGEMKLKGIIKHGKRSGNWDRYLRDGGNAIIRLKYEEGKIIHSELINASSLQLYEYNYKGDETFKQFTEQLRLELKQGNVTALCSYLADSIYTSEYELKKDQLKNKNEYLKSGEKNTPYFNEYILALFSEALNTGITPAYGEEIEWNSKLSNELFFSHNIANDDLAEYYKEEDLALPANGPFLKVYAEPIPNSQPIGTIAAYPGRIHDGCTNDKDSYDGCWYKITYNGDTCYINDIDEYHKYTEKKVIFKRINGEWKILGWF